MEHNKKIQRTITKTQERDDDSDAEALNPVPDVGFKEKVNEKSNDNKGPNQFMQGYTDNLAANANYMGSAATSNQTNQQYYGQSIADKNLNKQVKKDLS